MVGLRSPEPEPYGGAVAHSLDPYHWYWGMNAGGIDIQFGKFKGKRMSSLGLGYLAFVYTSNVGKFWFRRYVEPYERYTEALLDLIETEYKSFVVPFGKKHKGQRIGEVRDKEFLAWCWKRRTLTERFPVFFAAVEKFFDNPHHQEILRDIGDRCFEYEQEVGAEEEPDTEDEEFIVEDPALDEEEEFTEYSEEDPLEEAERLIENSHKKKKKKLSAKKKPKEKLLSPGTPSGSEEDSDDNDSGELPPTSVSHETDQAIEEPQQKERKVKSPTKSTRSSARSPKNIASSSHFRTKSHIEHEEGGDLTTDRPSDKDQKKKKFVASVLNSRPGSSGRLNANATPLSSKRLGKRRHTDMDSEDEHHLGNSGTKLTLSSGQSSQIEKQSKSSSAMSLTRPADTFKGETAKPSTKRVKHVQHEEGNDTSEDLLEKLDRIIEEQQEPKRGSPAKTPSGKGKAKASPKSSSTSSKRRLAKKLLVLDHVSESPSKRPKRRHSRMDIED